MGGIIMKEVIHVKFTPEQIEERITELAKQIMEDFKNETVTLICILKGGVMFMVDLARKLEMDVEYDFMEISSYGDSQTSSGVVKINKDIKNSVIGKNVIVIEDIVDTGRTLQYLVNHLKAQKPKVLKVCALLDKPTKRVVEGANADYVGFTVPNEFLVGYGLDNRQLCRNLPYVGVLEMVE
jgi:hypoxanthine phosphoribosyltransferase